MEKKEKKEKKTEKFVMRVTEEEHFDILRASGKHNSSEYLRRCEKFHRSFHPDFLTQIEQAAELSKQDVPTVIQQLLTVYMAQDFAIYEVMGKTKTYSRAFSYEKGKLVTGNELSDKVAAEVKAEAMALKKRLEAMKEGKIEATVITREEAGLMAARL